MAKIVYLYSFDVYFVVFFSFGRDETATKR